MLVSLGDRVNVQACDFDTNLGWQYTGVRLVAKEVGTK
jgi:hypothetical protein